MPNQHFNLILCLYDFLFVLEPETIIRLVLMSKKSYSVYSQDIIWWIHLSKSYPELKCVDEFMLGINDELSPLRPTKAMKAFSHARKCRNLLGGGKYKIEKDHTFKVCLQGLVGKLPKSEDIRKTVGESYDLMCAFQSYFLYQGEIFQVSIFFQPIEKVTKNAIKDIKCFLIMGNERLYGSRSACKAFSDFMDKNKKDVSRIIMLDNKSSTAKDDPWQNYQETPENAAAHIGEVAIMVYVLIAKLRTKLEYGKHRIIDVTEFSNESIAKIFFYILQVCRRPKTI